MFSRTVSSPISPSCCGSTATSSHVGTSRAGSLPTTESRPPSGPLPSGGDVDQRRLPRTRAPHQADQLAVEDVERRVPKGLDPLRSRAGRSSSATGRGGERRRLPPPGRRRCPGAASRGPARSAPREPGASPEPARARARPGGSPRRITCASCDETMNVTPCAISSSIASSSCVGRGGVEVRGRFVRHDDRGATDQHLRHRRPGLLAARELVRPVSEAVGEPEHLGDLLRLCEPVPPRGQGRHRQVLADGEMREEVVGRPLEDEPDLLPPEPPERARRGPVHANAAHDDASRVGAVHPREQPDQRRLPASRRSGHHA